MSLTLEAVTKTVGAETHLYGIDLELAPGSLNILLGPTLAGKTSLMRLMAGLDRPNQGRVLVDGKDVTGTSVRKRSVAMVYQQFINYPSFTVYNNIAAPLRRSGLTKAEIDRKVHEAAEMLRIDGREFETHLYGIDLELAPGSLNILLGPTLAGKTSLMRLMAGLDRPNQGRVLVDGKDVTGTSVRKRSVAMVYQQFINYPSFTVYNNIAAPLRRSGLTKAEIDRKVHEAAEMLRIDGLLDRLPAQLSGGQQQRTALARALVRETDLLLLDEPLVNLDYKLREELRGELQAIFQQGKSIVVYATTEPLEALMLGGTCAVLDAGRVLQNGPTVEVFHHPASIRVARIFSDPPMNIVEGGIEGGEAQLSEEIRVPLTGHMSALVSGRYHFGVHAIHLFLTQKTPEDIAFRATVELAEISGSETFIHVSHGGVLWVVQEVGVHPFALGEEITIYINPRHFFVFDDDRRLAASPRRAATAAAAE